MAAALPVSRESQIQLRLTELLRVLEQLEAVISVSTEALRHQNCEKDADVARVLQRDVGDRLSLEIEKVQALIGRLKRTKRQRAKSRGKS